MGVLGAIIGAAGQIGLGAINNAWAAEQAKYDRAENFRYGEMAAQNADARTRALYKDFYSPEALTKQYKEAGLSPSMMYGGTPGQGGISGAMGNSGPIQTPFMPMSMIEGAQIANIAAQTEKTKAETKNINKDTDLKTLEETWNTWRNNEKQIEFDLLTSYGIGNDGQPISLFEIANSKETYEDFIEEVRRLCNNTDNSNLLKEINTEKGNKLLRNIYMNVARLDNEIEILSAERVAANFQKSIMNALKNEDFANLNGKAVIAQLKAITQTNDLTAEQKGAWNRLLNKIEKRYGETGKDIVLILGMILQNYMKGSGIQLNTGNTIIENKK